MGERRIGLFGPLVVTDDDRVVPVRGSIPRGIVARLAWTPGAWVTADELIADLWHDPPDAVLSSLRAHISRLRTRDWGDVLRGGREGYLLDLPGPAVDVVVWRELVSAASAEPEAVRIPAWTEAEALWQGEPLAGLDELPFVADVRDALWDQRATVLAESAEWRSAQGEHAAAVLLAEELAGRFPLREDSAVLLATVLTRAGRTADALEGIDRVLARLGSEQLPAPTSVLELRQAIIRQDPVVVGTIGAGERAVERVGVPVPLTRFVGRRRELELIDRGRSASRLVTLVGPAGVGKTRLAIEAARRTTSSVDDVQYLLDLATITLTELVVPALATLVGASAHSVEAIARVLGGRRALLVVDNAEHVLGAVAALVGDLLARCEGLSVLVTSRESLRMPGERIVPVGPLLGEAAPDAVQIFLHRVADALGENALDQDHLDRVAALCESLDGIPLALELAASRLDVLTVDELIEAVERDRRIPLTATAVGRHGSLENALEWSVSLLSDDERRLMAELSLFSASFSIGAVAAVCDVPDARTVLLELVRKSLVQVTADESGLRRFRQLDSVRSLSRSLVERLGVDVDEWALRHAAWMVAFAERDDPALRSARWREVRDLFDASRRDIQAAFRRAVGRGDRETAVRLVGACSWYWYERGAIEQALEAIGQALDLPGPDVAASEARACYAAAYMAQIHPRPRPVTHWVDRMSAAADRAADPALQALAAVCQSYLAAAADDEDRAVRMLDQAVRLAADVSVPDWVRCDMLLVRGDTLRALGRPAQALESTSECYRLASSVGHSWAVAASAYTTGKTLVEVGRAREAIDILVTASTLSARREDWTASLSTLNIAACALVALDRNELAARMFGAVDELGARHTYDSERTDGGYPERYRERARRALTPAVWSAEHAAGRTLGFGGALRLLAAQR